MGKQTSASFREAFIHSDGRTAIQSLSSLTVSSNLVKKCMTSLVVASSYFRIKLVLVPDHCGIVENGKVDELVRKAPIPQFHQDGNARDSCLVHSCAGSTGYART